ncbi:cell division protein FtsX [Novosphingobium sp. Chol11]|uniref:cell division protein FtsX n=1 Tax=Novosphingobium sp. Chol11 TaxID=1385763 RepID=UPI000BE2E116|nr:FtsX-like permease family protein [Novosphingobium sp. Chol11]
MTGADRRAAAAARHRLLPEGRVAGPMPWVIAIMMFLTVLAAASGLGLAAAVQSVGADLAGRATIQIVEANADRREELSGAAARLLRKSPDVRAVRPVDPATLADQIRPWLGQDAADGDLPIPALIDVELTPGATAAKVQRLNRVLAALSPRIRVEPHAAFLRPLGSLLTALGSLAAGIVLLMALATAAIVVLAARAAHDSHRGTIDVLHLMGATDVQIARLFQRRIGLDALFGGLLGFVTALLVIILLGTRLAATGSDLLAAISLPWTSWLILALLPIGGVLLSTLAARWTVLRSLGRLL